PPKVPPNASFSSRYLLGHWNALEQFIGFDPLLLFSGGDFHEFKNLLPCGLDVDRDSAGGRVGARASRLWCFRQDEAIDAYRSREECRMDQSSRLCLSRREDRRGKS